MGKRGPAAKPTTLRSVHGDRPDRINDHPTWPDGAGLAYVGIPFTTSYIAQFEQRRGTTARLLFDGHLDGWELLRSGLPAMMGRTSTNR